MRRWRSSTLFCVLAVCSVIVLLIQYRLAAPQTAENVSFLWAFGARAGAEGSHRADKILRQIFLTILGQVDDFNLAPLHRQQLFDVVEAKARQAVFMLHNNQGERRVGEHRVMRAAANGRATVGGGAPGPWLRRCLPHGLTPQDAGRSPPGTPQGAQCEPAHAPPGAGGLRGRPHWRNYSARSGPSLE